MDTAQFTSDKTGRLVEIQTPYEDWAFVPDSLPPNWKFPVDLWPLLTKAHASLARLDGIGGTLPDPALLLRPLQDREAIRSSTLEGTYASPEELLLFELEPQEPASENDPANSWLEVANHNRALRQGIQLLSELPFCLRYIRELHKTLLSKVRGKDRRPGEFRNSQNHIGSDRRFIPPPPDHLHDCLQAYEKQLNQRSDGFDPLVHCFLMHYQFEAMHPFLDGNGRIGRVMMSLMIFKLCDLTHPWLYLSPFFERHRDEYIDALFKISSQGAWAGWIEFCLRGTIAQATDAARRCDQLRRLRDNFIQRAGQTSPRAHSIIEGLFTHPVLRIPDLAKTCSVTYPTAKADVDKLIDKGILHQLGTRRPKAYYSPEIFSVAYSE